MLTRFCALNVIFFASLVSALSVQPQDKTIFVVEKDNKTTDTQPKKNDVHVVHKRFYQLLQAHKAKKNQSITCPELQNYTFTNEPPFDVLGIPECGPSVQPMMMLYLPPIKFEEDRSQRLSPNKSKSESEGLDNEIFIEVQNLQSEAETQKSWSHYLYELLPMSVSNSSENESQEPSEVFENSTEYQFQESIERLRDEPLQCELIPGYLPNNVTESCIKVLNARKDMTKLVILIHGFLNSFQTSWLHEMQATIQELEPNTAILIFGWGHGLEDLWNYWRAARNARYAARALFEMIKYIQGHVDRKLYIHCAGHSLGAHVCGLAGKYLRDLKDAKIRKFDRISGMDPAGPMFANDVPYPFSHLNVQPSARLGPNDADYVDVIHTDGNARYLDYIPQYGTLESLGTVDFYPGSNDEYYGCYQPGCYDVVDVVSCSHSRSHQLYAASLDKAICLASRVCSGDPHKIPQNCKPLNGSEMQTGKISMGYWLDVKSHPTGLYTVEVDGTLPFCIDKKY